jgi:hypothetical protein
MSMYKFSVFIPWLYQFSDFNVYLYTLSSLWTYLFKFPGFYMTYTMLPVLSTESYLIFRVVIFIYVIFRIFIST